jgi:hypothetical protein
MCEVVCIRIIRIISKKSLFYLNVHLRSISNTCTVLAVFIVHLLSINVQGYIIDRGPGSAVGIAAGYGLDGPGIESGGGEIFRTCPGRPWGHPAFCTMGTRSFPGIKSGQGVTLTPYSLLVL